MAGQSPLLATEEQRTVLMALARSRDRGEADRACGAADAVRLDEPAHRGGLRRTRGHGAAVAQRLHARWCGGAQSDGGARPGACEERGGVARGHAVAGGAGRRSAELDHSAPARRDRGAGGRAHQPLATVQGAAQKKFRWRRPRHTLKGRQDAAEVERVGLRLQLRKQQAEAGDIILLYGDESEALTHPYRARAWAKTGADLRVPAPGQAKKVALLGSLDHAIRELVVHTSPTKRSSDFVAHLEQLDRLYGPKPGQPFTPVVLVEDNGPIHTSKLAMAALATRVHWLTVEWLPKYAPELNDIETVWRDLKAHHLAHQTFDDIDALNDAIHQAVDALNAERAAVPLARLRNSA